MLTQPLAIVAALTAFDAQMVDAPRLQAQAGSFSDTRTFARAASTAELAPAGTAIAQATPAPAPVAEVVERRPPALTREQHNVVRFIAQRYSVASDAAHHFVTEAYRAAQAARVDPLLVLAVMSIESSFNPMAQSNQGAKGLMQVLARVHRDKFEPFGGAKAVFDPIANIRVGTSILKEYLTRTGSVPGALKWYVGAAQLDHDGGYGAKVLFERARIAAAAAGKPMPKAAPRIVIAAQSPPPAAPTPPEPAPVRVRWSDARAPVGADALESDRSDAAGAPDAPAAPMAVEPASASATPADFDRDI